MSGSSQRLVQIFTNTLNPNGEIRARAEHELASILEEPDVVEGILQVFLTCEDISIRQMILVLIKYSAGVTLQKYITYHWSATSEKFIPPLIAESSRPLLRRTLFEGLANEQDILRKASAYAVALIGKYDWPAQWPSLMGDLITLLRQGTDTQKEGALQVVVELMKETLDEDQLPAITTELLPVLLEMVNDERLHWSVRIIPIRIFEDVIGLLSNAMQEHYDAARHTLDQVGPVWMNNLGRIASADIGQIILKDPGLMGLLNSAFSAFSTIESNFPKFFGQYRPDCIRLAVHTLSRLVPFHWQYSVKRDGAEQMPNDYDADLVFGTLAFEILTFLAPSSRAKSVKSLWVKTEGDKEVATDLLAEMVRSTAGVMPVTYAYLEDWDFNASAFIAADDEEAVDLPYDSRFAGLDLIGSMIDLYPHAVATQLQRTLEHTVQGSLEASKKHENDWWQPLEAVLTLLCALSDDIRSILLDDDKANVPHTVKIQELYSDVVAGLMFEHDAVFIQGKAFVFAGTFAPSLPTHAVEQAFSAAADIVTTRDAEEAVKLSACKAIKLFCRHVDASFIRPRASEITSFLLTYLRIDIKEEPLYLILETLNAVMRTDLAKLDPHSAEAIGEAVFDVWLRNATDPVATAIVEEVFEMIVSSSPPPVIAALVTLLSPRLGVIIDTNTEVQGVPIAGEAVQLVNSMIRTRKGPLEIGLITGATIPIVRCLHTTEDMDVVQHGMLHLTQIIRKDCEKLLQWTGPDGRTGMDQTLSLLARFLDPNFSESGAIFVGDCITHLFRKASQSIQPIMQPLVQTLVNRMVLAKMPSFIESLVLPLAYLMATGFATQTLGLLGTLAPPPGPNGESPAPLVLRTWCEISDDISGSWNIRVSALGLATLFAMPDPSLRSIMVRGDLVINEDNRDTIMTRSRAKKTPNQYTSIPFPLKALKIILKELHLYKSTGAGKGKGMKVGDDGALFAEDDGDEEWDDDDDLEGADYGKGEFDYLSSWLDDGSGGGRGNDSQEDDDDLREDPVAQIDMISHLTTVLRQAYATNENGIHEMVDGLTESEKGILKAALTM